MKIRISYRKLTRLKLRLYAAFTGRMHVHFMHIRKTGGTAIKNVLIDYTITGNSVIYLHHHSILIDRIPRGHKIIFAVRDPVARFVSGFVGRLNQSRPGTYVPWSPEEEKAFGLFMTPEELAIALDSSHPKYEAACHAMKSISHLNNYQWDWLGDEKTFHLRSDDFFCIARQETLTADFNLLKRALALPEDLKLPSDVKGMNRSIGPSVPPLSEKGEQNVRGWYQKDFELIELCDAWRKKNGGPVAKSIFDRA
jgi:Sulfotransferase family